MENRNQHHQLVQGQVIVTTCPHRSCKVLILRGGFGKHLALEGNECFYIQFTASVLRLERDDVEPIGGELSENQYKFALLQKLSSDTTRCDPTPALAVTAARCISSACRRSGRLIRGNHAPRRATSKIRSCRKEGDPKKSLPTTGRSLLSRRKTLTGFEQRLCNGPLKRLWRTPRCQ